MLNYNVMGITERRVREKQALRQEILDAARELFVEHGYQNVSMRKIADKIEYSPTTIYLYFQDKSELLGAICEETFAKLSARLEEVTGDAPDPVTGLKIGLRAYVDFGLANPHHYEVVLMSHTELHDAPGAYLQEGSASRVAFGCLRDAVAEAIEMGQFRALNVDVTAQSLWVTAHGLVSAIIGNPGFPFVDHDVLIESTLDAVIRGFQP